MEQKQTTCLYCGKTEVLYPVKKWDKDETNYYCDEHYRDAVQYEREDRKRFIEFYSTPEKREWLSKELLELWEKLRRG